MKYGIIEEEYDKFFREVEAKDPTGGQMTEFLKWCYETGFLVNINREDLDEFYEEESFYFPTRSGYITGNNRIAIGGYPYDGKFLVGIDPRGIFDTPDRCSIVAAFPLTSKREISRFYRLMEKIIDKTTVVHKNWFNQAKYLWRGAYAKFE